MWDLTGPPDAEPLMLGRGAAITTIAAEFEPTGRWLAAENLGGVTFWPATRALALGHESLRRSWCEMWRSIRTGSGFLRRPG